MKYFALIALLAVSTVMQAQTLVVRDERSGRPLDNVAVYSTRPPLLRYTDVMGRLEFSAYAEADSVRLDRAGYISSTRAVAELRATNFEVTMAERPFRMEEVVIAAVRWRLPESDIPHRIVGLYPVDAQLQNPQTVADLLGSSGEVYIQKSQLGGGSPMIRGFATNRVLIAVDGVRMNTAIFRSGNVQNVISLDAFALQESEVVFGPGSVSYGSDAIGGVMSFYTMTPRYSGNGGALLHGNAVLRGSSANEEKTGHVDLSLGLQRWAFLSSVSWSEFGDLRMGSDGPDDYLRPSYAIRVNGRDSTLRNDDPEVQTPSGYRQWNFMQKIRFAPGGSWDLQYGGHYSRTSDYARYDRLLRTKGSNLRSAEWYYGPQIWSMHTLSAEHSNGGGLYDKMKATAAWQYFAESRHDRDFGKSTKYHRDEEVNAFSVNVDAERAISPVHELFYGIEFLHNTVGSTGEDENILTGERIPGPSRYPDGSTWMSAAAYAHHRWKVAEAFTLQSGVRANYVTLDAEFSPQFYSFPFDEVRLRNLAFNGSIGGVYRPGADWQIDANLSTGYRAPNIDDIGKVFESTPGLIIVPNPDLKPEFAWNAEVGLGKTFGDLLRLDVSAFYTLLDNAMVRRPFSFNGQDSIMYNGERSPVEALQNAAQATVRGIQAGVDLNLGKGLRAWTRLTVQKGEEELDDGSTAPLRHAGPWFGTTHLLWSGAGLEVDFYAVYNGEIAYNDLAPEEQAKNYMYALDENGNPWLPSWLTWNVKARYRISDLLQLTVGLENITDVRYRPYSSGITAAGRNLIGAVQVRF